MKDRAKIDKAVEAIEAWSGNPLPPEKLKKYLGTELHEMKVKGDRKQLRPLCFVDGDEVIILCGAIEKTKIPRGDITTASNLLEKFRNGDGYVRSYYED